jgi:hypothetical protein
MSSIAAKGNLSSKPPIDSKSCFCIAKLQAHKYPPDSFTGEVSA